MKCIGTFIDKDNNKQDLYVTEGQRGLFFLTNYKKSIIYEWFVIEKAIIKYCETELNSFEKI